MSKATLENRLTQLETAPRRQRRIDFANIGKVHILTQLETAPRRQRTVQMMTDTELCKIIGIADPTDEQLMAVIEGKV